MSENGRLTNQGPTTMNIVREKLELQLHKAIKSFFRFSSERNSCAAGLPYTL